MCSATKISDYFFPPTIPSLVFPITIGPQHKALLLSLLFPFLCISVYALSLLHASFSDFASHKLPLNFVRVCCVWLLRINSRPTIVYRALRFFAITRALRRHKDIHRTHTKAYIDRRFLLFVVVGATHTHISSSPPPLQQPPTPHHQPSSSSSMLNDARQKSVSTSGLGPEQAAADSDPQVAQDQLAESQAFSAGLCRVGHGKGRGNGRLASARLSSSLIKTWPPPLFSLTPSRWRVVSLGWERRECIMGR